MEIVNSNFFGKILKEIGYKMQPKELKDAEGVIKRVPDVEFDVKLHRFNCDDMKPDYGAENVRLNEEDEIYVSVHIKRKNSQYPMRVEMKNLTKVKDCSWWIIVGSLKTNEVYYIKKTFFNKVLKRGFQLTIPEGEEKEFSVFLVSDSYIGIDQIREFDLAEYRTPSKGGRGARGDKKSKEDRALEKEKEEEILERKKAREQKPRRRERLD